MQQKPLHPKNKTLATWLALMGGALGLHRFYLFGFKDLLAWLTPIPTLWGYYGVLRVQQFGQDDRLSWVLVPLLGISIFAACLTAIFMALSSPERWQQRHSSSPQGACTGWLTVIGAALALLIGTGTLMASLAFGFQRYFEYQIAEAQKISQ